jgi:hippurate hydrolase
MQSYVTRTVNVFDPAVLTVARIEAGSTFNVIPEVARMHGTFRTVSERTRKQVNRDLRNLIEGIARAHGATAELRLWEGYPVTANDDGATDLALGVARDLFGEKQAVELPSPIMGAEDFSYVLERVPGAMLLLGVRPDGVDRAAPNHSNRMVINEEAMASGIALYAALAQRALAERSPRP